MNKRAPLIATIAVSAIAAACGGGDSNKAPVAKSASLSMLEDSALVAFLSATDPEHKQVTYSITTQPQNGVIRLDSSSGQFTYQPSPDYFGSDSFAFVASDGTRTSAPAVVSIAISNVDDPPRVAAIADQTNSPYSPTVLVPLSIVEVDHEATTISAQVDDSSIADVVVDQNAKSLVLTAKNYGDTTVIVSVQDAVNTVTRNFVFHVGDVTKKLQLQSAAPDAQAIQITNQRSTATDFELRHNGNLAFARIDQIVEAVRSLPDEIPNEPFERKLWRFVRDSVYHNSPISAEQWLYAIWPTMNSLGWGFCGHVDAVFVQIARAAGYEARIWGLSGHVVPEILVSGTWRMYDPDLAVYYFNHDGSVASVADLSADPTLISSPVTPIFKPGVNDWAYSPTVANIYGTTSDNLISDNIFLSTEPFRGSRITLPAGAKLTYPGKWTPAPIGYDGSTPYTIWWFRQAKMDLPSGFTGDVESPWVLWDIQGTGTVQIMGLSFAAGSAELRSFLSKPGASVTDVTVTTNDGGLAFIYMVNALWYEMKNVNAVELTGKDVWALDSDLINLPTENLPPPPVPASVRKPRP